MTIYVEPRKFIMGLLSGLLLSIIVMGIYSLLVPSGFLECPPRCKPGANGEISLMLDNARPGLFEYSKVLCFYEGAVITGDELANKSGISSVRLLCDSPQCSGEGANITLSNNTFTAMRDTTFRAVVRCSDAAHGYRCDIEIV